MPVVSMSRDGTSLGSGLSALAPISIDAALAPISIDANVADA